MTTPTETPDLSQFTTDPDHTSGMNPTLSPVVTSGAAMATVPTAPAAAPPVYTQAPAVYAAAPQAAPYDDERIARLEQRIKDQDDAAADTALKNKFVLPADATDKFEEDTLNMMQKSALYALSTPDGISLIESVIKRIIPGMMKDIDTVTAAAAPAISPAAPDINSVFTSNFQMSWDQIKMLPSYSAYMAQTHNGRPVFEWVKQFADQGDMTNIIEFIRPLVEAARATQPPAPHAPVGVTPGFVPAPQATPNDNANPDSMQFSEQKLAPLLKKASRGGWASLTADEQYILSTADQAASEGRVVP